MGRGKGKGKGKKQLLNRDETVSGEDEKLPVRRRGRPQKPVKDNIEEEDEVERIEEDEDIEESKNSILSKSNKNSPLTENGRKRKRPSPVDDNADSVKDENGKTNSTGVIKSVGFRQIGSRRKNKPRRAAEVGVECK